jgi:hypothetical protein
VACCLASANLSFKPLTKPKITNSPAYLAGTEGEASPNPLFNASITEFPNSLVMGVTAVSFYNPNINPAIA